MEENKIKTNFLKEVFKSIKDLDKYEDFALQLPKVSFKYILKLIFISAAIITLFYSYKIVKNLGNIYENLKDKLPEFSYSQGILTIDSTEPIILKEKETYIGKIIIDTKINENEAQEYKEELKNSSLGLLLLKDKVIVNSNTMSGQVVYNYSDIANSYGVSELSKQSAIEYIGGMNIVSIYLSIYFVIFMAIFMECFIFIFGSALIFSLITLLTARIAKIKFKFATAFNIAAHSVTLPAILYIIYAIVNLLTGFYIRYFWFMYNTISYIYVVVAILMIKTDFINRQIELIKLAEEQAKVKEELKKEKEEKQKEEEKQDKEKKEKKEKKKNEEDGELGEGVNLSVIEEKH